MKYFIYMHKSIITAIISIIVMCGCANDEIEVPTKHEDKLYFNATIDRRADQQLPTRAYTGDIDFAVPGFTVAGYYTNGEFSTSNPNSLPFPNVFDYLNPGVDAAVINVTKDNNETNTNRQYWTKLPRLPLSNIFYISYFAWSSSIPASIEAGTSTSAHKGAPWIDAQVGAANVEQPDIVGAVSMNHNNEYTVSAIDLDFKHLLSKMSFKVKASDLMKANITKVECIYGASAVYSKARFTFDGSADVGSWGGHKSYLSASTVTIDGWNKVTATTTSKHLGSMTFIPQSLTDDALKLKVTYTTTQGNTTSSETVRMVSLKALDMEAGKNYVYTLDIKTDKIDIFNVTVESWIEIAGTDKGLPLVPGAMDPGVLLLLEGTDPPYTTSDGNKYWLDRSGWNRHCLILDKTHYSGEGSFDITYDGTKRGYVFHRQLGKKCDFLYNHIRIPDLGSVTGNVGCEVVSSDNSTYNNPAWEFSTVLAISRKEEKYNTMFTNDRVLLVHTNTWGTSNIWDYAANGNGNDAYERITYATSNHDWKKISFYGYGRINGQQKFCVVDNANSSSRTATNNTTSYPLAHGMIGPGFMGVVNYVKITKKSIPYDEMMKDYTEAAKKYYITAGKGMHLPPYTTGMLACWDARSGLIQGATNGNGAFWADQSGNNNYVKAVVPSYTGNEFIDRSTATYPNIAIGSLKDDDTRGVRMEMLNGIKGKYSSLTVETVSLSYYPQRNYLFNFYDKNGKPIFFARANTGGTKTVDGQSIRTGIEVGTAHTVGGGESYYCNENYDNTAHYVKRSLVFTIDFIKGNYKTYLNGTLITNTSFNPNSDSYPEIAKIVLFSRKEGDFSFTGDIFAIRVYNKELTQPQIQTNLAKDKSTFGF